MITMKKAMVIGLVFLWSGCTASGPEIRHTDISKTSAQVGSSKDASIDLSALVKKVAPSVAVIRVFDKENKLVALGTGFLISDDGKLVTNYHVIQDGARGDVKLSSGEILPIEGIHSEDTEGDLVVLTVEKKGKSFPYLGLSNKSVETGQRVFVIGTPFGFERTLSEGIISAVREIRDFGKILQITAPISEGSSGSPVLDMKGDVIGVATLYIKEGQSLNFAIPIERVNALLSKHQPAPRRLAEVVDETKKRVAEAPKPVVVEVPRNPKELVIEETLSPEALKIVQNIVNEEGHVGWQGSRKRGGRIIGVAKFEIIDWKRVGRIVGLGKDDAVSLLEQAVRMDPNYHAAHYLLGIAYSRKDLFEKAVISLKRSIEIKPEYPDAYLQLGEIYEHSGSLDEAILNFKKGIEKRPDSLSFAHYQLSYVYERKGQYEEATRELREAISLGTHGYPVAKFRLGMILIKTKQYSDAVNLLKEIEAAYIIHDEEYKEAVEVFEKELESNPRNLVLFQGLGHINFLKKKYDLSIQYFEKAKQLRDFSSLLRLGISYYHEKKYEDAKSSLSMAVSLDPANFQAHMYLGLCYLNDWGRGKDLDTFDTYLEAYNRALDKALPEIKKAVEIQPNDAWALHHLGDIYASKGDYESALAVLQKAVAIAPRDISILQRIAYVYRMKKQYNEAIDHYRKALEIKEWPYTYAELGQTYEDMSAFDKALECYHQANRMVKSDYYDNLIAWVYLKQKNYREAIQIYNHLVTKKPRDSSYRSSLAFALSKSGKKSEAIREYLQVIRFDPDHWDSHYNLGLLYMEEENRESLRKAIEHFRKFLGGVKGKKDKEEYVNDAKGYIEACNDRIEGMDYPDKIKELSKQPGPVGIIAAMLLAEWDYSKADNLFASGVMNTKPVFKELAYSKEKVLTEYQVSSDLYESQAIFRKFEDSIKDLAKKDDRHGSITGPFLKAAQNRIEGIETYSKAHYMQKKDYRGEFEKGKAMVKVADTYFLEGLKSLFALMKKHPNAFSGFPLKRMERVIEYYENK